jgi:hypothetical protein
MIIEIIKYQDMSGDFETDWFPVLLDEINNFGRKAIAESLQISWQNVTGTLDGKIDIYISNDQHGQSMGNTYLIDTTSNIEDCEFIVLSHIHFKFIKLKYSKNSITGGLLNANLSFSEE